MSTLTKPHQTYEKPGIVLAYDLGTDTIYKGALVGLTTAGRTAPLSPEDPMRFLGVSDENADPAGPARRFTVAKLGTFVFGCAPGFHPTSCDLGRVVYAATDWQVTVAPNGLAHATPVGTIVAIERLEEERAFGVRIRIDLYTV